MDGGIDLALSLLLHDIRGHHWCPKDGDLFLPGDGGDEKNRNRRPISARTADSEFGRALESRYAPVGLMIMVMDE